jgi:PAS domain S-box-containing protein
MSTNTSSEETRRWNLIPWMVLLTALILTLTGWYVVEQMVARSNNIQFQLHIERLKTAITNRLGAYEQMLRGVSVFAAHSMATHGALMTSDATHDDSARDEWHIYLGKLQLDKYYPGIQTVGFGPWIPASKLEEHIAAVRAEGKFPQYTVYPKGQREAYVPALFLEPLTKDKVGVVGFDMFSESIRRAALQYARNTGETGITNKLTLVSEKGSRKQSAFLMYFPIYREDSQPTTVAQRQAAIVGFVYGAFRMNDLMKGIFGATQSSIDFEVYDGTVMSDATLMYDDSDEGEMQSDAPQTHTETFQIAEHTWTLHFTTLRSFEREIYHQTPLIVLFGGLLTSLLLFGLTWSWTLTRLTNRKLHHEIGERQQITDKLQQREQLLRSVIDNIPPLIFWKDRNSVYLGCNQAMAHLGGLASSEEIIGKTDFELAWRGEAEWYQAKDKEVMDSAQPVYKFEETIMQADGSVKWIQTSKIPLYDANNQVIGILGTSDDITERRQAEVLLKEYNQRLEQEVAVKTKALRKEEERFSLAMLGATDGLWDWNLQTNEVYYSPRWKAMLGFTEDEIANHVENGMRQLHPDDRPKMQAVLTDYTAQKIPAFEITFRMQHKQGHYIWILSRAKGVWQADKLIRLVGTHVDISEQKHSEQVLQQQQQFLRLIIDNIPQLIFWKDVRGHYLGCNKPFANRVKLSKHTDIVGKIDEQLFPSNLAQKFVQADRHVLQSGLATSDMVEKIQEPESGAIFWLKTNKMPLHDANGNIVGVLGTSEDITEQKQAETLLKEYNQRLESEVVIRTQEIVDKTQLIEKEQEKFTVIMDSLELLIYVVDLQSYELLFANQFARQHFQNDLIGGRCWQMLHPDKSQPCEFCTNDQLLTAEGKPNGTHTWEYHDKHNDRWFYVQDRAIYWTDGRLVRFEAATDITGLKRTEAALQTSETRFRRLHEGLRDGVAAINMQGKIIEFNPAFQQMLGYEADELYQLTYTQLTPTQWITLEQQILDEQVLLQGYSELYEKEYIRKDGSIIPVELRAYLTRDQANNPISMWAFVRDITERKQSRAALIQAKEAAEQAKLQADIANQAKSSFLANMSHELRTPLNGILGYAQILLRDKTVSPEQRDGLGVINRSGEYLLTLINDVLDLAKIEASRIELYPTDFHFSEFLDSIVELFQMRAQQKEIAFNYEPLSVLPEGVYADEKRLRQMLINLLGNAVKFTQKGGVTLKVGQDKDNNLRFQVEDTGMGISPEEINNIFEPFQQVGDQRYRAEGTGLGLSITKRLVEMMGGKLQVRSELGKGSTFWITLNLPETKDLVKSHGGEQPIIIGYTYPRGETTISQGLKILVVDDKWENRSIIVKLLEPLGFILYEAEDGAEGLRQAIEILPDLIFTDLVMPVLDGFELTRQLRKLPEFQTIPIVAASASVFDYHQQESFAAGCNAFIPKPIRFDILLDLMQQHLNGLTWIMEQEGSKIVDDASIPETLETTQQDNAGLSPTQAKKLYELGMMGDIESVFAEIDLLQQTPGLKNLAKQLYQLANDFKLDQICELMQPYMR